MASPKTPDEKKKSPAVKSLEREKRRQKHEADVREDTEAWEALPPLLQAEVVALAPKHHESTRVASSTDPHYHK